MSYPRMSSGVWRIVVIVCSVLLLEANDVRAEDVDTEEQNPVVSGLKWLADHQNQDGSWSFDHTPGGRCSGFSNPGTVQSKMGATGLVLLPFLESGHTHKSPRSKYRDTVFKGLAYLVSHMNDSGLLYERNGDLQPQMYCHGIAANALITAYDMTKDPKLKEPAQKAIDFIVEAQHEKGGWRYRPGDAGDTSVLAWQMMALKAGKLAYLNVPKDVYPKVTKFLDSVQSQGGAAYSYRPASSSMPQNYSCTAIGIMCRTFTGWKREHPTLNQGVKILSDRGPSSHDMYFNFFANEALWIVDGKKGKLKREWNKKLLELLLTSQVKRGRMKGTWHFLDQHGNKGGRVYNTALAVYTLTCYGRYGYYTSIYPSNRNESKTKEPAAKKDVAVDSEPSRPCCRRGIFRRRSGCR